MSEAPRKIELTYPADIDAEPEDVGGIALDQVADVLIDLRDVVLPATAVQVRSSYQSRVLAEDPGLPASELALAWEEAAANGRLARLRGVLETAVTLCESARKEV